MNPRQSFASPSKTSSTISIVAPSDSKASKEDKPKPTATATAAKANSAASKRTCRNVIIHGFCKFEGQGCEFNHDTEKPTVLTPTRPQLHALENSKSSFVSADSIHAPVFVPQSSSSSLQADKPSLQSISADSYNNGSNTASMLSPQQPLSYAGSQYAYTSASQLMPMMNSSDTYYYMNSQFAHQPAPQYHQYAPTLPHIANLQSHERLLQSFYIPDNLREQLLKRNQTAIATATAKDAGLPKEVHVYHSLHLLEDKPGHVLGHASWVYKAVSRVDGKNYTMIRVEGFRLVDEQAMSIVKDWRKIRHANIVSIHEAFTSRAFGDSSLVFIYDYHPCSITLFEAYFSSQAQALLQARFQAAGINGMAVPETTLWSFITQIASALKTVHDAGLSSRNIDTTKIIMTSKNRLRITSASLLDVLQFDNTSEHKKALHQQEDLLNFGNLIISLACNSPTSAASLQSFEYMSRFYSPDLKTMVYYLLGKPSLSKTIDEAFTLIGPRLLHELNSSQYYTDTLESNLGSELENSRLVKLMSKLNFINERPEFDKDPKWSETGDRYIIKLFRDYIFHQADEMGLPNVDMGHVLMCLNKLDAGIDEKILLTSRDDQTTVIVSYKELKSSIASAFNDIQTKTAYHKTTKRR